MDKGEMRQAWQDLVHSPVWKAYCLLVQNQQNSELARLLAQARNSDTTNGYHAGFYEGLAKALSIPKEEIERNG